MRSGHLPAVSRWSPRSSSHHQLPVVHVPVEVLAPLALDHVIRMPADVDARPSRNLEGSATVQRVDIDFAASSICRAMLVVHNVLHPGELHVRHGHALGA